MAKIYDQLGQPEDARRLRFWAAQRTTRVAPRTSKLVRWPYAVLVGYGYYPQFTLAWLAALWLIVFALTSVHASAFTPTNSSTATVTTNSRSEEAPVTGATEPPANYPPFNAGLFAVDTAIPAAATGQADAWRVTSTGGAWLTVVFAAIKGIAWLLTALLLAGITGILRKD